MTEAQIADDVKNGRRRKKRRLVEVEGVYFIRWGNYIKVGTAYDIAARARQIMFSIPEGDVEIIAVIGKRRSGERLCRPDRCDHEAAIHKALNPVHARGEWFHDTPAVRAFIARYATPWPDVNPAMVNV